MVEGTERTEGTEVKRALSIGLRVLGVLLVLYILFFQVQYRDVLVREGHDPLVGTVEKTGPGALFRPADGGEPIPLAPDWDQRQDVKPGLFTIVRDSRKFLLAFFVFLYGPITLISITRWWYLLREVGVPTRYMDALRLTFVGFFFNSVVPGLTGGDIVKAVYISRRAKGAGMKAFMSVLVDRVIGLFALGVLSALVLVPNLGDARFRPAAAIVFLFLGISAAFGCVFLSGRLRSLIRLESLIRRLPFSHVIREVDQAIVVYRHHLRAVGGAILLSLLNHGSLVIMAIGMGRAIGMTVPTVQFFILVPVCMMMASVPLLPGGWGVREGAFVAFFGLVGVLATKAFALSVLIGLTQLAWSLLGGVFFLTQPDRLSREEVETLAHDVEAEVTAPIDS